MEHQRELMLRVVLAAGFDQAGALPLDMAGDPRIREWLGRGYHGSMAWLERHAPAKTDPAQAFDGFRSLIVAALDYGEVAEPPADPATGNISRYALGDDYHDVLRSRLQDAADCLHAAVPGIRTRIFVDTGPINEKIVASRAGLGWVGKHTNLIHPARGSYLFLGIILTSVEVPPPNETEPDRCGICDACITACPTGAIVAPYVLDASRCISYLTIELKGAMPRSLRPFVGNRIFGCDDCQDVCPWNRFARKKPPEPFEPRERFRDRQLSDWLRLTEEEWRITFEGSPVTRPGYYGFLRNVLVAAGCAKDRGLVQLLATFLEHDEALLRGHAAWALGSTGGPDAATHLCTARDRESDETVQEEIAAALEALAEPDTV